MRQFWGKLSKSKEFDGVQFRKIESKVFSSSSSSSTTTTHRHLHEPPVDFE
jgi:hypothetical protein